jgi:hypothetical protein
MTLTGPQKIGPKRMDIVYWWIPWWQIGGGNRRSHLDKSLVHQFARTARLLVFLRSAQSAMARADSSDENAGLSVTWQALETKFLRPQ